MGCIWRRVDGADFASASRFVALVLPMLPPITPPLGTPFFGIITIPISIQSDWDGDDRFCGGSHVRQIVLISLQGRSSVCEWHVEAALEIEFSGD
jgi:hypothetical protein